MIISKEPAMMEVMAFILGALGIYLLFMALFLTPLSLIPGAILHIIRNLKEQKDPLLS